MGRKKKPEEHVNHERWMVSYADFITLLFAFFVMLYSISIVNTGKFKVLSESITAAFTDPQRSLEPIQVGDLVRAPAEMQDKSFADPQPKPIRPVEMRQMAKLVDVEPIPFPLTPRCSPPIGSFRAVGPQRLCGCLNLPA